MTTRPIQDPVTLFVAAFALAAAAGIASDGLYHRDEVYYVEPLRHMLASGDWLTPVFDGKPRLDKPILLYWLGALGQIATGEGLFGARLVSVASAVLTLVLTAGIARRVFDDERVVFAAVAATGSTLMFFSYAHYIVPEMALVACMTGGHLCYLELRARWRDGRPAGQIRLLFYLAMAVGFMVKGPPAVFLPLLAIVVHALALGRPGDLLRLWSWSGAGLFVLVVAPWYLAIYLEHGGAPFERLVKRDILRRLSRDRTDYTYYVTAFVPFFLPWSLVLVQRAAGRLRRAEWDRGFGWVRQYPVIWLVTHVVFFSLFVREKYPWYALDWAVPAALTAAMAFRADDTGRRWRPVLVGLAALALGAGAVALLFGTMTRGIALDPVNGGVAAALFAAAAGLVLWAARRTVGLRAMTAATAAAAALSVTSFHHFVQGATPLEPAPIFARVLVKETAPFTVVASVNFLGKRLHLYPFPEGTRIETISRRDDLAAAVAANPPDYVVAPSQAVAMLPDAAGRRYEPVASAWYHAPGRGGSVLDPVLKMLWRGDDPGRYFQEFVLARRAD